jgi:hypothetical protein
MKMPWDLTMDEAYTSECQNGREIICACQEIRGGIAEAKAPPQIGPGVVLYSTTHLTLLHFWLLVPCYSAPPQCLPFLKTKRRLEPEEVKQQPPLGEDDGLQLGVQLRDGWRVLGDVCECSRRPHACQRRGELQPRSFTSWMHVSCHHMHGSQVFLSSSIELPCSHNE